MMPKFKKVSVIIGQNQSCGREQSAKKGELKLC
jgi:hypothetical protein